jgi:hypothetical protein
MQGSKVSIPANINSLKSKVLHDKREVDYPLSKEIQGILRRMGTANPKFGAQKGTLSVSELNSATSR